MQQVRRGITVFNSLLFDEEAATPPKPESRGRDKYLLAKRDEFLVHRAYYKSKLQRKLYEDVLAELESEVFLSRLQIQRIIMAKSDDMMLLKKQQLNKHDLQRKFPWVSWE